MHRSLNSYAYHAIYFEIPSQSNIVARETYSLFELFGDIGGLVEFLYIVVTVFVSFFSEMKVKSLVASRLYYW